MFSKSKQRVFIPMMLMGFLFFGAVSAQAYERRSGDRVKKGAAVAAAVGTLVQILQGHTEGHQLLKGAVVGGVVGGAVGATRDGRHGRYDGYYYRDGYDRRGYYRDGYDRGGYYRDGYEHRNRGYYDSRDYDRYDRRYDGYYDGRSSHRHSRHCRHR